MSLPLARAIAGPSERTIPINGGAVSQGARSNDLLEFGTKTATFAAKSITIGAAYLH